MKSGLSSAQGKTWPLRLGVWLCGAEQMYAALSSFFHTEHKTASDYTVSESQPVSFSRGGMVSISSGGGWGQAASPWSLVSGWDSNPHFSLDLDNEVKTPHRSHLCALILLPRANISFFLSPCFHPSLIMSTDRELLGTCLIWKEGRNKGKKGYSSIIPEAMKEIHHDQKEEMIRQKTHVCSVPFPFHFLCFWYYFNSK